VKLKFKPWMLLVPVALLLFVFRNRIFGALPFAAPKSTPENVVPLPAVASAGGGGGSGSGGEAGGAGETETKTSEQQLAELLQSAVGTEETGGRAEAFNERQDARVNRFIQKLDRRRDRFERRNS
jgi:hypothetical protein